ncbi:MAG: hypothetical protein HYT94_05195 [Parcubacteria group bacterium]|nr:hypothetical protein [Parcubacteria group bacterium]
MKKKSTAGIPISAEVSEESLRRLTVLKEKMGAETYGEVFSNALRLFEDVVKEADDGAQFYIDRNNSIGPVLYEIFETTE